MDYTKYNKPEKGDVLYTRVGSFGEAAVIEPINNEFDPFIVPPLHRSPRKIPYDRRRYR